MTEYAHDSSVGHTVEGYTFNRFYVMERVSRALLEESDEDAFDRMWAMIGRDIRKEIQNMKATTRGARLDHIRIAPHPEETQ